MFSFRSFSTIFHSRFNPDLDADCPVWVTVFCGVSFAFYTMMDAVDGRQARRTNTSSPLGQLFDHGCDCVLAGLLPILVGNALGTGTAPMPIVISAAQIVFFTAMWEEKYVGECRTTIFGLIGTSEILTGFILLQLLSGTVLARGGAEISRFFVLAILVSFVMGMAVCVSNVLRKTKSMTALKDLLPILIVNGVFQAVPIISTALPYLSLTLPNSLLTILMIVSSMGKSTFPPIQIWGFVIGLLIAETGAIFFPSFASDILLMFAGVFCIYFLSVVVGIVLELRQFLGISVLTITPAKSS